MEELLKLLGFTTPLIYATAAYGFFHCLDDNASDEAMAALARTMSFKDYKREQIASALVEVFDRIYTHPLLRWRAFFRSLLLTTVVSAIFMFEVRPPGIGFKESTPGNWLIWHWKWLATIVDFAPLMLFNVLSDYLSLFVIRPSLARSGTKPVTSLVLGAVSGFAIVLAFNLLRSFFLYVLFPFSEPDDPAMRDALWYAHWHFTWSFAVQFAFPALAVFAWLPLFALGILIARLLTPLSWIVGRTQWFLKEGKEHPLKAIGWVAAVVVFVGTVAGRAAFGCS